MPGLAMALNRGNRDMTGTDLRGDLFDCNGFIDLPTPISCLRMSVVSKQMGTISPLPSCNRTSPYPHTVKMTYRWNRRGVCYVRTTVVFSEPRVTPG